MPKLSSYTEAAGGDPRWPPRRKHVTMFCPQANVNKADQGEGSVEWRRLNGKTDEVKRKSSRMDRSKREEKLMSIWRVLGSECPFIIVTARAAQRCQTRRSMSRLVQGCPLILLCKSTIRLSWTSEIQQGEAS